jgi:phosphoglycolate phosphatase-like HAD superfamily hydrolase
MLKFKNYLFDLDGTLTDPGVGIRNSIKYALNKFGLPCPSDDVLNQFIGPPLMESFRKYCGVRKLIPALFSNTIANISESRDILKISSIRTR